VRPDAVIFVVDRPEWAPLPEGIPQFDTYYDQAELLPPERFSRLRQLLVP
jgi:hypothetical protein